MDMLMSSAPFRTACLCRWVGIERSIYLTGGLREGTLEKFVLIPIEYT